MKNTIYFALSLLVTVWLGACSHNGSGHDHSHHEEEEHSHGEESHSHEEEEHDHENGHNHASEEHKDASHDHEGAIVIEPEKAASFGIETITVEGKPFSEVIAVSGQIENAPTDQITVTARRSGLVTLSPGIIPGVKVNRGMTICTLSSKGIQGGDVNVAVAAGLEKAKKELERLTPLYKEGIVTASEFNEAERAYKEALALVGPGNIELKGADPERADISGVLTDLYVTSGQYVEAGAPIATIAKNTQLTLRADVPERYLARLSGIVSANFRPDYSSEVFSLGELEGKRVAGDITTGSKNGYIPVYFTFMSNGVILPGSFAEIYLKGTEKYGVVSLPRTALIEMQGNKYVYVCKHGHAYEKKLVATGATDGLNVEIIGGIEPGEVIVTKGASIVRMAETSAIAPPGHTHNH